MKEQFYSQRSEKRIRMKAEEKVKICQMNELKGI